jgi:hypothetical protein
MKHQDIFDRLRKHIVVDANGCWIWQRSLRTDGYGQARFRGKPIGAHRVMWYAMHGELFNRFQKIQVCHSCDTRPCINPAHLWKGSTTENANDRDRKGRNYWRSRTHCKRGHELTPDNLLQWKRQRVCRECVHLKQAEYRERKRLQTASTPRRSVLSDRYRQTILDYWSKGYSAHAIYRRVHASPGQIDRAIARAERERNGESIRPIAWSLSQGRRG